MAVARYSNESGQLIWCGGKVDKENKLDADFIGE
jgi:hypothetical protein